MKRYFVEVSYDGIAFHGSQLQGELPTVQGELNRAIAILLREEVVTFGASRTDEGVHALANYYHFDTGKELTAEFVYRINAILPGSIAVRRLFQSCTPDLNARFHAVSRRYRYRIYSRKNPFLLNRACFFPYKLDMGALEYTSGLLKECTDFKTFSKRHSQTHTFLCTVTESYWEDHGGEWHYVVRANRFLRGMVRGLVGTQLRVARGLTGRSEFVDIVRSGDCTRADFSVPGHGLYLEEIVYPEGGLLQIS